MLIRISNETSEETGNILDFLCEQSIEHEILKENNGNHFAEFCREEAEFRLLELDILDDKEKEKVENLSKEQLKELIENIKDKYIEKDIFDYNYMDYLLRKELEEF